jgi:hypothetical protein
MGDLGEGLWRLFLVSQGLWRLFFVSQGLWRFSWGHSWLLGQNGIRLGFCHFCQFWRLIYLFFAQILNSQCDFL